MVKFTDQEEYGWYGLIWTNAMLKLCCFRKSCWPSAQPKPPWKPSRKHENGHWTGGICRKSWCVGRSSTTFHIELLSNLGTNRNLNLRKTFTLDRCPIRLGHLGPIGVVVPTLEGQQRSECRSSPWTSGTCHRRTATCWRRIKIARPEKNNWKHSRLLPMPLRETIWNNS